jgi:drug/metabolite transporter (DMT)-like permease
MINNEATGVIAACAAPFFMAFGFIIWEKIWKTSGGSAFALNMFKCNVAAVGFLVISSILGWTTATSTSTNIVTDNHEMEKIFTYQSLSYLILSGFIGIIIGDLAWLEALRLLGATKVLVIDSIKPFTAALMGWFVLDESINNIAYSGIFLTVLGILIVSLEREKMENHSNENIGDNDVEVLVVTDEGVESSDGDLDRNELNERTIVSSEASDTEVPKIENSRCWKTRGYIFAVGNVILDTYGSILTKQYGAGMSTWSINLVRFGSAGLIMILISLTSYIFLSLRRNVTTQIRVSEDNDISWFLLPQMNIIAWLKICVGVLFVTFICPALSNYALFQISLAFALTLGSISPLYALILEWPFHGTKPSFRAIIGAGLAIGGVCILAILRK